MEISATEYLDYQAAKQALGYWVDHIEAFKEKVRAEAVKTGDRSITVGGREVFTHTPIAQFATKRFEKEDAELAEQYKRPVTVIKVDVELIKRTNPALYAEYQVYRLEESK